MKRIAALLLICLLLPLAALAQTLGQGSQRVFDDAGLMTTAQIDSLETVIAAMRKTYNTDIVVLTSYDAKIDKTEAFADDYYDYNGFGQGTDRSGLLLLIDMTNRMVYLSTSGLMIRYVTDQRRDILLEIAYQSLEKQDYAGAAEQVLARLETYLKSGIPSNQYNQDEYGNIDAYRTLTMGETALSLAAGLIAGLIFVLAVRHRYGMKGSMYRYDMHANSTVSLTGATDVYLRTQVTKTPKASSGGRPGGFSGGGRSSTHHSSSGSVHGGGGRRF